MLVRRGLCMMLSVVALLGTADANDSGQQSELKGDGDQIVLVDLRGVKKATAIYRICISKETSGSPLIVSLFQQRNLAQKPKAIFRRRLQKGDSEACIDMGVREDRYIKVSSLKNGSGPISVSYRLMAAF